MRKLFVFLTICAAIGFVALAQQNYYGPPAAPDALGNSLFGVSWRTSSTMVSNTVLGTGAGTALVSGTNNIYVGSPGKSNDSSVVRIGNAQTNIILSGGIVSGSPTNVTAIAQGSTGYTNNLGVDAFVYIYATNGAISLWAGNAGTNLVQVTGIPSTAGMLTFFLLPGYAITGTNIAGNVIAGP